MSLESLFLKEVSEKGDLSLTNLPKDIDQWSETIVSKIKEKLPEAKNLLMKVTFMQKDEELGTAVGCLTLHDQKLNKSIYIPIIAKNFKLYPMDVMIRPNKETDDGLEVTPLTKEYFEEAMFNNQVFDHLERPMNRIQQMYLNPQNTVVYPPYFRNVHASAQLSEAIKGTISKEDQEQFKQYFRDNPEVLVGYEKRAHLDILQKLATDQEAEEDNAKEVKKHTLNPNLTIIKKNTTGNYQITHTSDEVFNPIVSDTDDRSVLEELGKITENPEDTLHEVKRNGEYLIFDKLLPQEGASIKDMDKFRYSDADEKPEEADSFGVYKVMSKDGIKHTGIVFPTVINFKQNKQPVKIFYKNDKTGYQNKIVGLPTKENPCQFLKRGEPTVGMTGMFVTTNEKNAVATIPITVRSMYEEGSDRKIVAEDINGNKIKIKHKIHGMLQSPEEKKKESFGEDGDVQQITKIKDFYLVPKRFFFVPLDPHFVNLHENPGDMRTKVASQNWDAMPVKIAHTGARQFSVKGPDIEKMASRLNWDPTNLSAEQTYFLMTAKKCPLKKTAQAINSALKLGTAEAHHLPKVIFEEDYNRQEKVASSAYEDYIKSLRVDLTKEASKIDESEIVDSILSLNFINPENIDKFLSFVPYLKECAKMLAQSLLASRIGMKEIPEQDTQTAMFKLVETIKGLEKLEETHTDNSTS